MGIKLPNMGNFHNEVNPIGSKIKRVRLLRNHPQVSLAKAVNLSTKTYRKIENGHRDPRDEELDKIAKELQTTPESIHSFDENKAVNNNFNDKVGIVNNNLQAETIKQGCEDPEKDSIIFQLNAIIKSQKLIIENLQEILKHK